MAYLRRKIDRFLMDWKADGNRKPLVVKGPRQVGKTEAIRHFAPANYRSVVEINFVEEPKYRAITRNGYSADEVVKSMSLLDPSLRFIPHETLIFFDEIQDHPDIATTLKFFRQDGRFDVICSGSMLGINYKTIESNSVGYKTDYEMDSLDFEEFLWAKGYDDETVESMFGHLTELRPFSQIEMDTFTSLFLDYCTVGGMPEVVSSYIERGTFEGVLDMQRQLVRDYEEDIQKYADGMDRSRILNVFNHIPVQLAKENKKFQISKVARGARFKDYRGCVEWLETAIVCRSPNCPCAATMTRTSSKCTSLTRDCLSPSWTTRPATISAPTGTSACTRAPCTRAWSARRCARPATNSTTTRGRTPLWRRISSSGPATRSSRSR